MTGELTNATRSTDRSIDANGPAAAAQDTSITSRPVKATGPAVSQPRWVSLDSGMTYCRQVGELVKTSWW